MTDDSYRVTVRLEGDMWVARDDEGSWRAKGAGHFAGSAAAAVGALFHACEVERVEDCGDHAFAWIYRG